jgi:hypothetical protein
VTHRAIRRRTRFHDAAAMSSKIVLAAPCYPAVRKLRLKDP